MHVVLWLIGAFYAALLLALVTWAAWTAVAKRRRGRGKEAQQNTRANTTGRSKRHSRTVDGSDRTSPTVTPRGIHVQQATSPSTFIAHSSSVETTTLEVGPTPEKHPQTYSPSTIIQMHKKSRLQPFAHRTDHSTPFLVTPEDGLHDTAQQREPSTTISRQHSSTTLLVSDLQSASDTSDGSLSDSSDDASEEEQSLRALEEYFLRPGVPLAPVVPSTTSVIRIASTSVTPPLSRKPSREQQHHPKTPPHPFINKSNPSCASTPPPRRLPTAPLRTHLIASSNRSWRLL
jgi:hypothetical protein